MYAFIGSQNATWFGVGQKWGLSKNKCKFYQGGGARFRGSVPQILTGKVPAGRTRELPRFTAPKGSPTELAGPPKKRGLKTPAQT